MRDIQTTVMGNATADPSERIQPDNSVTAILRVAVTGRYFDNEKNGFSDRKTEFITVFARRALARNVLQSVSKGQPVVVTGRLGSSEWVADDGTQRHSLTLQAEAVGHDLTFGTTRFVKPVRAEETPDIDPQTGEVRPEEFGDEADPVTALTGSAEEREDALATS